MQVRDAAFFVAMFVAIVGIGIQLSAAGTAPPPFTVCTNSDPIALVRGQSLLLSPAQLDPTCPITVISAGMLGHVPGGVVPQLGENAVSMTVAPPGITLTVAGTLSGNADEIPITIAPNSIAIFGT